MRADDERPGGGIAAAAGVTLLAALSSVAIALAVNVTGLAAGHPVAPHSTHGAAQAREASR